MSSRCNNSGFKILSKQCYKQMFCHPGFVPFIEHRQSRFSIILKSLKIFRNDKLAVASTKVTSYISP